MFSSIYKNGSMRRLMLSSPTTAVPHHFPNLLTQIRNMFIETSKTPNPQSLKFLPHREVLPEQMGSGMNFENIKSARNSLLATRLFDIEGVKLVYFGRDFVTVTKDGPDYPWEEIKVAVFSTIMDFYAENLPVVENEPIHGDTTVNDDDDEIVAMIKELIEEKVRPSVNEDGGDIFFEGFDEETGIVKVRLAGACSGCPSSSVTLKNGVENMLQHYIPEVKGIEEVTDEVLDAVNDDEFKNLEKRLRAAGINLGD